MNLKKKKHRYSGTAINTYKGKFFTGNQDLQNQDYDVTKWWFHSAQ